MLKLLCLFLPLLGACRLPLPGEPSVKQDLLADYQVACRHLEDMCEWKLTLYPPEDNPPLAAVRIGPQPEILADTERLLSIRRRFGRWAIVWIFAHEGGHVMDFRAGLFDGVYDRIAAEESADEWGGCVVALADGDIEQAVAAILIVLRNGGETHPEGEIRAAAARRGYQRCGG